MKGYRQIVFLAALLLAALAGAIGVRFRGGAPARQGAATSGATDPANSVDTRPLKTAQSLTALAATPQEQEFAAESQRLADQEVDLDFAAALRHATLHPAPPTPASRTILARIAEIQTRLKPEQDDVARLKLLAPKAGQNQKESVQDELQLQEALLEADQDELDAAQQELIRAGGDPRSVIQQLMDQHEASHHPQGNAAPGAFVAENAPAAPEATASRNLVAQFLAWRQLDAETKALAQAQAEVKACLADLGKEHQAIENGTGQEDANTPAAGGNTGNATLFSTLRSVAGQQQDLAQLDQRVGDFQQLDTLYGNWAALIQGRQHENVIGLIETTLWIVVLLLLVLLADPVVRLLFLRLDPDSRRLHMLRTVTRFATQAVGVALMLLVIFGPPSQLATVIALAGAGLTVALKDFLVGFFGWFILMGPNGIRPGDWVEIEGVGGEVLEVGLLHTVLLETGNWSDAGHPTGRKVTFVNSYAIEGHYFNFSMSGQWLWDEIQVPVSLDADPYATAEAIQKVVTEETAESSQVAEKEWQRVVTDKPASTFSAAPAISVRPIGSGVNVIVRYITQAKERHEVRSRLYHKIVEVVREQRVGQGTETPKSASPSR